MSDLPALGSFDGLQPSACSFHYHKSSNPSIGSPAGFQNRRNPRGTVSCRFVQLPCLKSVIIEASVDRREMKSKSSLIWVLSALMAIAAVDNIPDPPAVNPHSVSVASRLCDARGGICERRLNPDWSCSSSPVPLPSIAFTAASEPNLPSDRVVLTGQAADPSPPALAARRNL